MNFSTDHQRDVTRPLHPYERTSRHKKPPFCKSAPRHEDTLLQVGVWFVFRTNEFHSSRFIIRFRPIHAETGGGCRVPGDNQIHYSSTNSTAHLPRLQRLYCRGQCQPPRSASTFHPHCWLVVQIRMRSSHGRTQVSLAREELASKIAYPRSVYVCTIKTGWLWQAGEIRRSDESQWCAVMSHRMGGLDPEEW